MKDLQTLIVDKASTDERFREKVGETLELHGLLEHPGWLALKKHFENGSKGYGQTLAQRLMDGVAVDQREIDEHRGMLKMAEAIFMYPTLALSQLEHTAELLIRGEFEQEVLRTQMQSPFIDLED